MTDIIKRQYSTVRGDTRYTVTLTLDIHAIAQTMVNNAVRNTSGEATSMYGAVTAYVITKDDAE